MQRHGGMTKLGIKISVARTENPGGRDEAIKGDWRKIEIPVFHTEPP